MIIVDRLPYFVFLKNRKYKINVDYRVMIKIEKVMQDSKLSKQKRILKSLEMFYPAFLEIIKNNLIEEACNELINFYKGGHKDYQSKRGKNGNGKQLFSYEYDSDLIVGAFLHDYRLDLTNPKVFIHWWKFKALMKSLNSENMFVKVKSYRAYTGNDKEILELQRFWELPLSESEQERIDSIVAILNGKEK